MIRKGFPLNPLDSRDLLESGLSRVQGGFMRTPIINPLVARNGEGQDGDRTRQKPVGDDNNQPAKGRSKNDE